MKGDAVPVKKPTACATCAPGALPIKVGDLGVTIQNGQAVVCAACFLRLAKGGRS